MQRREFLGALLTGTLLSRALTAEPAPADLKVTRVVGFRVICRRSKVAGKNSRLDVHGDRATDRMLRIFTNQGVEGLGNCRASEQDAAKLLGTNPLSLHQHDANRMTGPLGRGTMPLWDLLGKLRGKPVYELLGGKGPARVPVYDGSIYFADLLPQYQDRWEDRFREEIDMARKVGHVAVKVKIGRGAKWMPRAEGDARDAAVVRLIRKHAGADLLIGVDANNGYDLEGTKRLFDQIGEEQIAFAEEMFPEHVEQCLEFKAYLRERGLSTLVADGETQGELDVFKPFIQSRAIDVYQGDMNRFGFEGIRQEAAWAAEQNLQVAPHNWGSLVGFYMQLQVGRAIHNFYRAEHDPLSTPVLVADDYRIAGGTASVPQSPGCGIAVDEQKFADDAQIDFDVKL